MCPFETNWQITAIRKVDKVTCFKNKKNPLPPRGGGGVGVKKK